MKKRTEITHQSASKSLVICFSFVIGGSKGGARDAPPGSKFFHFHTVTGKNLAK